jgi:hypothetical protein
MSRRHRECGGLPGVVDVVRSGVSCRVRCPVPRPWVLRVDACFSVYRIRYGMHGDGQLFMLLVTMPRVLRWELGPAGVRLGRGTAMPMGLHGRRCGSGRTLHMPRLCVSDLPRLLT